MKFTNALISETSPYLLQHAHNPVQWYPWGEEALALARESDKPILVSIGYAACHWCHVMERESFENEEVAAFMNQHFINIKIDREERPDLDHIYMDAVQAIAGNGGWPLNVFLTTDARPFYGGTYFPPRKAFNRSSWTDVLNYMVDAWHNKRDEVEEQARTLLEHVKSSSGLLVKKIELTEEETNKFLSVETCHEIAKNVLKAADKVHGGFGQAPKFPQTMTIQYLLAYGFRFKDSDAMKQAELSLQKLVNGGIYDQLAGGMSRYSTDSEWLAPHFEKMLYDNALLVNVLCDAYQITKNDFYEGAIHKTLGFFINEMKHPEGGFYAAVDADSEGEEGKFYVWNKDEIETLLGAKAPVFIEFYDVSDEGNWEHKNILQVKKSIEVFAEAKNMEVSEVNRILEEGRVVLLAARVKRIAPAIDDKILLGWNALLLTAFCKASACLGSEEYKREAVALADFIFKKFTENEEVIFHSYKNNRARHPAFLDDLAYLIQGCIWLQQVTGDNNYLAQARKITESVFENFFDAESGLFFFSGKGQTDLVARKLEVYDGATPAGNSIMAENLFYLSTVYELSEWRDVALKMLMSVKDVIIPYPTSFGVWANLILQQISGVKEVAVTGSNAAEVGKEILKLYLPGRVLQVGEAESEWPLLKNKLYEEKARIYVCKNYVCGAPVLSLGEFSELVYD